MLDLKQRLMHWKNNLLITTHHYFRSLGQFFMSCHVINAVTISFVFSFLFLPLDLEWNWCSWIQEILMQSLLFSDLLYKKKNVKGKKKVPQSKNALKILDCVFDILIVLSQFQKFITDRFSNRGFTDLAFGLRSDVDLLLFFSLYLYKGV